MLLGYYNIFPRVLDDPEDYISVAKNILYLGIFVLSIGILNFYREFDIFAILMSVVIIGLFLFKLSQQISK